MDKETRDALLEARHTVTRLVSTSEKWRYDQVCWVFAIMLGEIPEDTEMPPMEPDKESLGYMNGLDTWNF